MADSATDNDEVVYAKAKDAAYTLDMEYRKAVQAEDWDTANALKPSVNEAYAKVSDARTALIITPGIQASDADVQKMEEIEAEINAAANTQQLVGGAVKLVQFLTTLT
ncbi:hypothetical protein V5T82_03945 [Magnetovibrio sp. PR-2]|uniref:hypothetical protein n=1 Tax=Magnetovibrio sp. PR-2 TaxID=3120356 RepID=UPI002FCE49D2